MRVLAHGSAHTNLTHAQPAIVTSRTFSTLSTKIVTIAFYRDTGLKLRLRRWSRGVLVTVSGGGHIAHFAPLYKSESPTQA